MSRLVVLDTGPLGLLTNPKRTPETVAAAEWAIRLPPPDTGYWSRPSRTTRCAASWCERGSSLRVAADLWARARNAGTPTADAKELDCDVLIAAQAIEAAGTNREFAIATANLGHLGQFAPAELWSKLDP